MASYLSIKSIKRIEMIQIVIQKKIFKNYPKNDVLNNEEVINKNQMFVYFLLQKMLKECNGCKKET